LGEFFNGRVIIGQVISSIFKEAEMSDLFSLNENPKSKEIAPITFDPKTLRTAVNEKGETVYCLSDVLAMVTETKSPKDEMYHVKRSLAKQGVQLSQIVRQLKFRAKDGKRYSMLGGTREQIFRVLQEVNSPRVAPFKSWLAKLANERIEEIENPEKGIINARSQWKKMGKSDAWISKRIKGIATRNEECETLKQHGITAQKDFAYFTDRTNLAVYGRKAKEEKEHRHLPATANLRDNSSEREIALLYLHEDACKQGIEKRNAYGKREIDGVYDVVGSIISNTARQLSEAFA
jgi:phosphoribosyl-ATP pyrophosphohydrolase